MGGLMHKRRRWVLERAAVIFGGIAGFFTGTGTPRVRARVRWRAVEAGGEPSGRAGLRGFFAFSGGRKGAGAGRGGGGSGGWEDSSRSCVALECGGSWSGSAAIALLIPMSQNL